MKKMLALALSLLFILILIGCTQQVYKLPWDHFCYSESDGSVIELEAAEKEFIIDLLNNGDWYGEIAKCSSDVKFYTQQQSIGYCIEEGIFNDFTLGKSLKISEGDRVIVNGYLSSNNKDIITQQYFYGKVIEKYDACCLIEITDAGNQYHQFSNGEMVLVDTNDDYCPKYSVGDYFRIVFNGTVAQGSPNKALNVIKIYKTDSIGRDIE